MSIICKWLLIQTLEVIHNGSTSLWRICSEIKKLLLISSISQNQKCYILEECRSWSWVKSEMKESTMAKRLGKLKEVISVISGTIFNEKFEKILIMKAILTMKVRKRRKITRIRSHLQRGRNESDITILWAFSTNFSTQVIKCTLLTLFLLLIRKLFMTWFKKKNSYKVWEGILNCKTLSTVQRNYLQKKISQTYTSDFKTKKKSYFMNELIFAIQY